MHLGILVDRFQYPAISYNRLLSFTIAYNRLQYSRLHSNRVVGFGVRLQSEALFLFGGGARADRRNRMSSIVDHCKRLCTIVNACERL